MSPGANSSVCWSGGPAGGRNRTARSRLSLLWYKHHGYLTGAGVDQPGAWEGPKKVGSGWQGFEQVVAARSGHIYAVNAAGELLYYNHKGWRTGDFDWDAPIELGDAWSDYKVVFAAMGRKPGGPVLH